MALRLYFSSLNEGDRLEVFKNRVMRKFRSKGEEINRWTKLRNKELQFYSSKYYWSHQDNEDIMDGTFGLYGRDQK
jgi:hypothetical protein